MLDLKGNRPKTFIVVGNINNRDQKTLIVNRLATLLIELELLNIQKLYYDSKCKMTSDLYQEIFINYIGEIFNQSIVSSLEDPQSHNESKILLKKS